MKGWVRRYTGKKCLKENNESRMLTVILRTCEPGDEEGMIACIRDEYGETYIKPDFYEPAYLRKAAGSGTYTFLVAQTNAGEIAGILVLETSGQGEMLCEIESLFIRKKYRGYGLSFPLLQYGTELLQKEKRGYAVACSRPVLFHPVTQKALYRMGFRATGFLLNIFDAAKTVPSFGRGKQSKYSVGLQLLPLGKKDAGMLYAPPEHSAFLEKIYRGLPMNFQMGQSDGNGRRKMPAVSELLCRQDRRQKSLEIWIRHIGADLPGRMEKIQTTYALTGKQTANVLLNINERGAVWAYGQLTKRGYFFTGIKSMGNAGEYMALHHPGEVECFFEEFAVSPEFAEILNYVGRQYERRNAYEKKKKQHSS